MFYLYYITQGAKVSKANLWLQENEKIFAITTKAKVKSLLKLDVYGTDWDFRYVLFVLHNPRYQGK